MPVMKRWQTGVYQWRNLVNGKIYVGGAYESFKSREYTHRYELRKRKHPNKHLQYAWYKYGASNFVFEILERCQPDRVQECEQKWLERLRPYDREVGYNICPNAGTVKGLKLTPEQCENRRKAFLGGKHTPETIAKMKAKVVSAETRKKMSAWQKGKKKPAGFGDKMSNALRGRVIGDEWRAKMSAAGRGKTLTEEHKAKIAAAHRTPEARARRSELSRAAWAKKRAEQAQLEGDNAS